MITGRLLENMAKPLQHLRQEPSRCLRMRYSGSLCALCAAVCPAGALSLDGGLEVQPESCTGCLACTTVCPTGALEPGADMSRILGSLRGHVLPVFVLGCSRSGNRCHGALPCLGMLSQEHLVALYFCGTALVQLDASACTGCPAAAARERLDQQLQHLGGVTGLPLHRRLRLVTDAAALDFRQEEVSRRSFFTSMGKLACQGVVSAIASSATEYRSMSYREKTVPLRRGVLLDTIASLPADQASPLREAFCFSASFDDRCDGCFGCVKACPTGALGEPDEPGAATPCFDANRCTGCRLCTEFCVSAAVTIGPEQRHSAHDDPSDTPLR